MDKPFTSNYVHLQKSKYVYLCVVLVLCSTLILDSVSFAIEIQAEDETFNKVVPRMKQKKHTTSQHSLEVVILGTSLIQAGVPYLKTDRHLLRCI